MCVAFGKIEETNVTICRCIRNHKTTTASQLWDIEAMCAESLWELRIVHGWRVAAEDVVHNIQCTGIQTDCL